MRPQELHTRIFLDSGDPAETREALSLLGFLDGQTTNPSLVAKNPGAVGKKFSASAILNFYQDMVREIAQLLPQGSVSIEVYADAGTPAGKMLEQAKQFNAWIPNAHIKFPTTAEGLKAAEAAVAEGMRVNMTLVFSQEQAAAVYAATRSTDSTGSRWSGGELSRTTRSGPAARGAKKGDVFISPFIGRLDDRGENGLDLIKNIAEMYKGGDGHVEILAASVRSLHHFAASIERGADIITAPLKALKEWAAAGMPVSSKQQSANSSQLKPISYQHIDLGKPWQEYNIKHELTDKGIEKFAADWNNLIS